MGCIVYGWVALESLGWYRVPPSLGPLPFRTRRAARIQALIGALCMHIGAESFVSRLVVPTEVSTSPHSVHTLHLHPL